MNEPTVVELLDTRIVDGKLEGLVKLSDGTQEWRPPSVVTVEGRVTRGADGSVEDVNIGNVSLGGPSCE